LSNEMPRFSGIYLACGLGALRIFGEMRVIGQTMRPCGRHLGSRRGWGSLQAEAEFEGDVYLTKFFGGDAATAAHEARFFDGHDLLTFDVGGVSEAVFFGGGYAHV